MVSIYLRGYIRLNALSTNSRTFLMDIDTVPTQVQTPPKEADSEGSAGSIASVEPLEISEEAPANENLEVSEAEEAIVVEEARTEIIVETGFEEYKVENGHDKDDGDASLSSPQGSDDEDMESGTFTIWSTYYINAKRFTLSSQSVRNPNTEKEWS